jgi:hypothetical protein
MTRWLLALSWWWHTWKAPKNTVSDGWLSAHVRERRDVD